MRLCRLPNGCFTGIDWSCEGAADGFDPYLVWAEATEFRHYAVRAHTDAQRCERMDWLPVVIELSAPHTVQDLVERASAWLRIPRVFYDCARSTAVPDTLRFFSARVRPEFFRQLAPGEALHGLVKRVELGLPVHRAASVASAQQQDRSRRWPFCSRPAPVESALVLGLIDDGLALAHQHFRSTAGTTRIAYYWRQDGYGQGLRPANMGYGREFTATRINAALAEATDAAGQVDEAAVYSDLGLSTLGRLWVGGRTQFHALDTSVSHGTHVMDLAAGPYDTLARLSNPPHDLDAPPSWHIPGDAASTAPIVAVQLDYRTVEDTSGGSMSVHILDALIYILSRCKPDAEVVVNISFGALAGPHDGSSLLERAMDDLIEASAGRLHIVTAAGNSYQQRGHANLTLSAGESRTIDWFVSPDDATPSFVEIWLPPQASGVEISLTPPAGAPLPALAPGQSRLLVDADGQVIGAVIYPHPPATGLDGTCILLALQPTTSPRAGEPIAPSGSWRITLAQTATDSVTIDAYIERDDTVVGTRTGARQSRFEDADYDLESFVDDPLNPSLIRRSGSFNDIATGARTLSVGGVRIRDGSWAPYSARWPDPDAARNIRPNVQKVPDRDGFSDECAAMPGLLAAAPRSGATVRMVGTSAAAPQVTRRIVNTLAANAAR